MAEKKKGRVLMCPYCTEQLDVGDHERAIVAVCNVSNKTCDRQHWGGAAGRIGIGGKVKLGKELPEVDRHAIQIDPPETEAA